MIEKRDIWVSLKKIIKILIKSKNRKGLDGSREGECKKEIFFIFFIFSRFSLRYMKIGPSKFVWPRMKSALDEGYVCVPKTRDFIGF